MALRNIAPAATPLQVEALLEFLEAHPDLARGRLRGADGRLRAKALWAELTTSLNAMGGANKTTEQWQRVWADRKHLAKKSAAAARRSATATGGGPSTAETPSQTDSKIISIMGEGFGEPQTTARTPAFPSFETNGAVTPPVAAVDEAGVHQQEDPLEVPLPRQPRRARRRFAGRETGAVARRRILNVEEERLKVELARNEILQGIKVALEELCQIMSDKEKE